MRRETTLRVVRPTDKINEVVRFYRDGVGLTELLEVRDLDLPQFAPDLPIGDLEKAVRKADGELLD